ncbi:hypothetical protein E5676_scaffold24967G00330 [Cucumis melo var. makuwa]|uniref:Uncharacterized protein n=1 Tax=Cucumis melo var. makuwa TaxID=1194695 RepID=A0A5D3BYJ0_CUCMM|nr:hypothetical protein E5676_scaffold24967G00330 [Cucumis melo var. makuwa]
MWLTEVCQHKSFSMDITPDALDWIINCFKDLLDTTTLKHFFTERRLENNCMWVRKTKNKSKTSITAEIFRLDNKGRKCSILVPEGSDKFRWKSFLALITFRPFAPTKRIRSEIRKEYVSKYFDSFSSDSNSSRKSYAKALSDSSEEENKKRYKSTSDDSSSRRSTTTRQSEMEFSNKSFQAGKAIHYLNPDHAKLFCSNKSVNGWSTVGNYQRYPASLMELQYFLIHWNGLWRLPCRSKGNNADGENFIITTVPPPEARWFVERNVRVHGSFKSKAADEFDEHNPSVEVYTYNGFQAIPSRTTKSRGDYSYLNSDKHSISNHTQAKKDNSSEFEYDPFDYQLCEKRKEKRKAILIINDQDHGHYSKRSKRMSKRKVSFLSPGYNHSHSSNMDKNIKRKSVEISTINEPFEKKGSLRHKSKMKILYRIKKKDSQAINEYPKQSLKERGEGSKQMNLLVDMGPISPLDSLIHSENNHGQESINNKTKTNAEGENPNQTNTIKEGVETIHQKGIPSKNTTAGILKDTSIEDEQENDQAFKEKLVNWLKENELKLSPKYTSDIASSSNFPVIMSDQNVDLSSHGPLGDKGNT